MKSAHTENARVGAHRAPDTDSERELELEPTSSPALRVLRPRRAKPADVVRPTRAEINLAHLRHNLRVLEKAAGEAAVWPVIKADAYGHGAPAVARTLERAGAKGFCVALVEEALELRQAGIEVPILVMSGYYAAAHAELIEGDLIPVVYDAGQLHDIARAARHAKLDAPFRVDVKVDTGMGRLGVPLEDVADFARRLADLEEIQVRGLMTHLACADSEDPASTEAQLERFDEASRAFRREGVAWEIRHAANSAALLRGRGVFDMARPGIGIFGVAPGDRGFSAPLSSQLKPVMRVCSDIIAIRDVPPGTPIGYGETWRANRTSRIATIAMGYADGLSRSLSNRGRVVVRGKLAPIVGAVSMDMAMIDVSGIDGVSVHDEVVVLGSCQGAEGSAEVTAHDVAEAADTIAWDVLTAVSRRVPRFFREP